VRTVERRCLACSRDNVRKARGKRRYSVAHRQTSLIVDIKSRAKLAGMSCDICTRDDIIWPSVCEVLGIELDYLVTPVRTNVSASIDRKDNNKGYTVDNVRVISWRANFLKKDATLEEIEKLCQYLANPLLDSAEPSTPRPSVNGLYNNAKYRAKQRNLSFTISKEDIETPKYCPVLGLEISYTNPKLMYSSPTLDKIDNTKGYTKSNVRTISWRANQIKNDGTLEEFKMIRDYLKRGDSV